MAGRACSFVCRRCNAHATVEELSALLLVVSCISCEVSEVLGRDDAPTSMDHFTPHDELLLPKAGALMN